MLYINFRRFIPPPIFRMSAIIFRLEGNDQVLGDHSLTKGEAERVERVVASLLPGPPETHRVVAVEKRQVMVKSSEVIMVNGRSIELEGQEGKVS